jgi:hypothetical protein
VSISSAFNTHSVIPGVAKDAFIAGSEAAADSAVNVNFAAGMA